MNSSKEFLLAKRNLVYKLLPLKEENKEWVSLCENIIVDLCGFSEFHSVDLETVLYKLKGIIKINKELEDNKISKEEAYDIHRRNVFACIRLLNEKILCFP